MPYKVVDPSDAKSARGKQMSFEEILNAAEQDGWKYINTDALGRIIFHKELARKK